MRDSTRGMPVLPRPTTCGCSYLHHTLSMPKSVTVRSQRREYTSTRAGTTKRGAMTCVQVQWAQTVLVTASVRTLLQCKPLLRPALPRLA